MWSATLEKCFYRRGTWRVVISYTDGVESFAKTYQMERVSPAILKSKAQYEVNNFESEVMVDPTNWIGKSIDLTPDPIPEPPTPEPPPTPTAEEIAKKAWFDDYDKLERLNRLVAQGLLDASDTRITNLQTSLQANWKNDYLDSV